MRRTPPDQGCCGRGAARRGAVSGGVPRPLPTKHGMSIRVDPPTHPNPPHPHAPEQQRVSRVHDLQHHVAALEHAPQLAPHVQVLLERGHAQRGGLLDAGRRGGARVTGRVRNPTSGRQARTAQCGGATGGTTLAPGDRAPRRCCPWTTAAAAARAGSRTSQHRWYCAPSQGQVRASSEAGQRNAASRRVPVSGGRPTFWSAGTRPPARSACLARRQSCAARAAPARGSRPGGGGGGSAGRGRGVIGRRATRHADRERLTALRRTSELDSIMDCMWSGLPSKLDTPVFLSLDHTAGRATGGVDGSARSLARSALRRRDQ